jgi:hypothetical protein
LAKKRGRQGGEKRKAERDTLAFLLPFEVQLSKGQDILGFKKIMAWGVLGLVKDSKPSKKNYEKLAKKLLQKNQKNFKRGALNLENFCQGT